MTNVTFAAYSNLAVYSAIVVLTLAMIAFAMDLAGAVPNAVRRPEQVRLLVGAPGPTDGIHPALSAVAPAERARKAAGAALAAGTLKVQRIEHPATPLAEGIAYSIQPATSPAATEWSTAANGTEYALSALDFTAKLDNRIASWAFTNTASLTTDTPDVRVSSTVLASEVYGQPPAVQQKPGPYPLGQSLKDKLNLLNSNDDRMQQVVYRGGRTWSGLNTVVKGDNGRTTTGIASYRGRPARRRDGQGAGARRGPGGPLAAWRHREAVRARPRQRAGAQPRRRRGLQLGLGLPDRPLPRQGDGPEHPRAAIRQLEVRAGGEAEQRRERADEGGRGSREGGEERRG